MLYYLNVFIHIVCAAFWIGGMLFLPLVVLPAIKHNPERRNILYQTGLKFRQYGWIALLLLLLTGLLNLYFKQIPISFDYLLNSEYGNWVGIKLILLILIVLVSFIHDFFIGKKAITDDFQKNHFLSIAKWSGRMMLLFSLAMVFIGVMLARGIL